ncbi:hypothetical protein [Variovorax saccharolyticus]|uniref:hypothetical protein n=1 Tax=Variovorax saccharolyticus TaxID=3053516 RepID=UPI0025776299|nr:hypothetical protein [Variovorax sp. J22R187]MDM0019340.1 hypothetical protein [Variovorax sp. J22R187]
MTRTSNIDAERGRPRRAAARAPRALPLLSRVLAAILGGYLLASAAAVFLAAVLPTGRAEGVLAGMQFSFAVYTGAVIWSFSPVALSRVWAGLLLPTGLLAASGWLLPRAGV